MNRFLGALALAILCPIFIFAQHTEVTKEDAQTITGAKTFSGLTNIISLNGVQKCDQFAGATIDVQLNACIWAAMANPVGAQGIADARGLGNGYIAGQVNVGGHSGSVLLLLPFNASWGVTITNSSLCAFMLYNQSSMIGSGTGTEGSLMSIYNGSGSDVSGFVCTDPLPVSSASYVRAEGFALYNTAPTGTVGTAVLEAQKLYDNSTFRYIDIYSTNGVTAMSVTSACCTVNFENVTIDCTSTGGCTPLAIGGTTPGVGVENVAFYDLSATHAGPGLSNITISANASNEDINFYNLYLEQN